MNHNRFDDLTRALAGSTSRRQALKLLGGGLLAALVPGAALAKGGGNSACTNFCAQVFGANKREAGKCTSEAAKGKGLCYTCGPKSDGTQRLCGTTCISSTEPCNGICPGGSKLCNGTCIPDDQCCTITPNPLSNYELTCYNSKLTCDSDVTTLSADCEDVFGEPIYTSIVVNTCSSSNYVIVNCNSVLTCGSC